ncbi:hypothetical protein FKO01_64525 [Mesorhizobium sp. B2-3-3]|nr:hypothetical protein FKO01_64525 [Mesorhizobium sp. B2-3-3]
MGEAGGTAPLSVLPDISPARGEIDCSSLFANLKRCRKAPSETLVISPLAGEMAGRPEGGVQAQPEPHQGALLAVS